VAFVLFPTPTKLAEALRGTHYDERGPIHGDRPSKARLALCCARPAFYFQHGPRALVAALANDAIAHTRRDIAHHIPLGWLQQHAATGRIFFVLQVEQLDQDLLRLWERMSNARAENPEIQTLNPGREQSNPSAAKGAYKDSQAQHASNVVHANPDELGFLRELSEEARCRLEHWLAQDYESVDFLFRNGYIQRRYERKCTQDQREKYHLSSRGGGDTNRSAAQAQLAPPQGAKHGIPIAVASFSRLLNDSTTRVADKIKEEMRGGKGRGGKACEAISAAILQERLFSPF
jgi:hypothetical protein